MITEESLQGQYSKMGNDELFKITSDKSGYTELAISVATKELKKRGISENEIKKTSLLVHQKLNEYWMENCLFDLNIWQKLAFYFILWIPRTRLYYIRNFKRNGYLLKNDQSNYYSVLGACCFIITLMCGAFVTSLLLVFSIWPLGFLLSYYYDINFNKPRQIEKFQKIKDNGELPFGY